jgi:hypothetical protein
MLELLHTHRQDLSRLSLEAWGTFLGGVTGPLALLWLILGYLQQGEELRLNTEALQLQQEELRHQVEETKALVKHAESQAQTAMEAFTLERLRYEQVRQAEKSAAQPFLIFQRGSSSGVTGELVFQNIGGLGRDLSLFPPARATMSIAPNDVLSPGGTGQINYSDISNFPAAFEIEYTDHFGERRRIKLVVTQPGNFRQEHTT